MESEPIIEELVDSKEELQKLKNGKEKKVFLGYYYNCLDCGKDGYLHNQHQLSCPRCGYPFLFENDEKGLEPHWQIEEASKFSQLRKIIDVEEDWDPPEITNTRINPEWEDYITDAI
jgi:DNA-directed RNA polymerase subunit RPC12/RpoP